MTLGRIVVLLFVGTLANGQVALEQYNISADEVSVSGLSAGGAFATQYHVIHSETIMGVGIFAGVPYYCAKGLLATALTCMSSPGLTNVNSLITEAEDKAANGRIDPVEGMSGDKVYIFAGTLDTTVKPGNAVDIRQFYDAYGAASYSQLSIEAEHAQPTEYYGASCDFNGGEYINDCDYYGAYKALDYIYGGTLLKPDAGFVATGELIEFDQSEFVASSDGMDSSGYVYIPTQCATRDVQCKLHVVFHGCQQQKELQGDTFATKSGYIEVGELNNIVLLFPQAKSLALANPNGCFDWWGYAGALSYARYDGPQIVAVTEMINRLI